MAKSSTTPQGIRLEEEQPPAPVVVPEPYRQGQLDALCGIYAIINGVRNACASASIIWQSIPSGLFADLLKALGARGQAQEVICGGVGLRGHEKCLKVAQEHLCKCNVEMTWSRPWKGKKRLNLTLAFKAIQDHLDGPGSTALLRFATDYGEHWTVIQEVSADQVKLSDSAGIKTRLVSGFKFGQAIVSRRSMRCLINGSSLVLVRVLDKTRTPDHINPGHG